MRGASATAVVALLVCLAGVEPVRALGVSYPDYVALATGVDYDLAGELLENRRRWSVEVCERDLFGGVGLRESGVRASSVVGGVRMTAALARLSATVGAETSAQVRVAHESARWMLGAAVTGERAAIRGTRSMWLAAMTLHTAVRAADGVRLGCDVERVRLAGLDYPGADIASSVVVTAGSAAAVSSTLVIDRVDGAFARLALAFRIESMAVLALGYDDGTGSLSVALAVTASDARATAGASLHPVLGLSRGISVGWWR